MKISISERMRGIERTLIRQIHDRADSSCIDLGLGEPPFPTPKPIIDHLKENIDEWHLGYTPNAGLPELRELVAEKSGLSVSADQVCVTVGAEEALFMSIMVTIDPGDEVLIPDPGFPAFERIIKIAGGIPKCYPLYRENGFSVRHQDVEEQITDKTKAVILDSLNNPTGAAHSAQEIEKLTEILEQKNIFAISDEVYRNIYFEEKPASIAESFKNSVVINSLSKSYSMTGWRLGWCIAPIELMKSFTSFNQMAVLCAPVVSQKLALFALRGFADEEKVRNIQELKRRRDLAMSCLDKYTDLDYVKPSGALYIFADISNKKPKYGDSLEISLDILEKEKVITIPGIGFGQRGEGNLRISFAPSPEKIEEGIRRIGHFFEDDG